MSNGISRIGDSVAGTCNGDYENYEITGYNPIYDDEGGYVGSDPIYGWVTRNESGTFTGSITSGSTSVFADSKGVARIGDDIEINKSYAHSNHFDSLQVTGSITSGSTSVFADSKGVAHIGCTITAPDVTSGGITEGSNTVFV